MMKWAPFTHSHKIKLQLQFESQRYPQTFVVDYKTAESKWLFDFN